MKEYIHYNIYSGIKIKGLNNISQHEVGKAQTPKNN